MYRIGDLQDKRVLVTGARVAVHGHRHAATMAAAMKRIHEAGGRAVAIAADLGEAGAGRRVVDEAAHALDGLDVLINNAGSIAALDGGGRGAGLYAAAKAWCTC